MLFSANDLARFHASRGALYRAAALLLTSDPTPATLALARKSVAECRWPFASKDALEAALQKASSFGASPKTSCAQPEKDLRSEAFSAAGLSDDPSLLAEALVLAALAD